MSSRRVRTFFLSRPTDYQSEWRLYSYTPFVVMSVEELTDRENTPNRFLNLFMGTCAKKKPFIIFDGDTHLPYPMKLCKTSSIATKVCQISGWEGFRSSGLQIWKPVRFSIWEPCFFVREVVGCSCSSLLSPQIWMSSPLHWWQAANWNMILHLGTIISPFLRRGHSLRTWLVALANTCYYEAVRGMRRLFEMTRELTLVKRRSHPVRCQL